MPPHDFIHHLNLWLSSGLGAQEGDRFELVSPREMHAHFRGRVFRSLFQPQIRRGGEVVCHEAFLQVLTPEGGGVVRMVEFTMPRAIDFAGAWRTPALLDGLTPDQLSHRQGCDLLLRRLPSGDYEGRNQVGECATDFAGATTLVQYLWVGPRYIRLLDRAYDDAGTLRWGSPGEGYVYLRH